jgi:type I restriction enzyme M protein
MPNGYLGNRSSIYRALREWLLRHCYVASICSFPRFTFKTSGADVSASVVFLEKRTKPLETAKSTDDYDFHVGLIQSVGWHLGDKGARPIYKRDPTDGSYLTDQHRNRVLDSDFDRVIEEMRSSTAALTRKWMAGGSTGVGEDGWSVSMAGIAADRWLTLDPKRLSRKATELREAIRRQSHYRLGDLVEFVPQAAQKWDGKTLYRYVQIDDIASGGYGWTTLRGWELPDRARHLADPGDVFIGAVWSSVKKWMMAGGDTTDLIVTNGCQRIRIKPEHEDKLLDMVVALSTDAYATQMRSLARGSDGLAEISEGDIAEVLIPVVTDKTVRTEVQPFIDQLRAGFTSVRAKVDDLLQSGRLDSPVPAKRPSHTVQV